MTKTIEINASTPKTFVEFTRAYSMKNGEVRQGPMTVALEDIASVVPSNRLGKANHRSTITLSNGTSFDLAERYTVVQGELEAISEAA